MDQVIDRLDESGKAAWLVAMILGFVVFWPIGLAILFYMIWSGRMGHHGCSSRSWQDGPNWMSRDERRSERRSRRRCGGRRRHSRSSGNTAFDAYREETLQRLEEEQQEFEGFLERLRQAKDKQEFDQFMAERTDARPNPEGDPEAGGEQDKST